MTTNGKGSMGEPSLGIQNKEGLNIHINHQYYLDGSTDVKILPHTCHLFTVHTQHASTM